jgi:hypothetical protein
MRSRVVRIKIDAEDDEESYFSKLPQPLQVAVKEVESYLKLAVVLMVVPVLAVFVGLALTGGFAYSKYMTWRRRVRKKKMRRKMQRWISH